MTKIIGKCPICGTAAAEKYKPFCSSRCSMLDLGKWLVEGYKVESNEISEESLPNSEGNEENE
jgi:endogenous inhibitor of DNA gyrase (YacG/DUF329 family)